MDVLSITSESGPSPKLLSRIPIENVFVCSRVHIVSINSRFCSIGIHGNILHQTGVGHGHSHGGGGGHDHSHSKTEAPTRKVTLSHSLSTARATNRGSSKERANINVRAAFIHVLGDIVQSVGVLVAAYIIKYKVRFPYRFSNKPKARIFLSFYFINYTFIRSICRTILNYILHSILVWQ